MLLWDSSCFRFVRTAQKDTNPTESSPGLTSILPFSGDFVGAWAPWELQLQPCLAGRAWDPWRCRHEHVFWSWGDQNRQVNWASSFCPLGSWAYRGLGSRGMCTHGLGVVGLHLLQAITVVLSGTAHIPQELGVHSLKRLLSLWLGFVVTGCAWCVLGLGHVCTKACSSQSTCTWKN